MYGTNTFIQNGFCGINSWKQMSLSSNKQACNWLYLLSILIVLRFVVLEIINVINLVNIFNYRFWTNEHISKSIVKFVPTGIKAELATAQKI